MSKIIHLTNKQQVVVNNEDYDYLMQWKWYMTRSGYAARTEHLGTDPKNKGKYLTKVHYMHCIVHTSSKDMDTDHKDGNKLNNQRSNLRSCTHMENGANQGVRKNNTSGFKGVHWYRARRKWQAYINKNYKRIHLGYFPTLLEAATAYNLAAVQHFGEYAKLNNIIKEK